MSRSATWDVLRTMSGRGWRGWRARSRCFRRRARAWAPSTWPRETRPRRRAWRRCRGSPSRRCPGRPPAPRPHTDENGHTRDREFGSENPRRLRLGGRERRSRRGGEDRRAYGVDGGLEVLGGAVGGEDEEERCGEDVRVGGVAPAARCRRGDERRGRGFLVAVGIHGYRPACAGELGTTAREVESAAQWEWGEKLLKALIVGELEGRGCPVAGAGAEVTRRGRRAGGPRPGVGGWGGPQRSGSLDFVRSGSLADDFLRPLSVCPWMFLPKAFQVDRILCIIIIIKPKTNILWIVRRLLYSNQDLRPSPNFERNVIYGFLLKLNSNLEFKIRKETKSIMDLPHPPVVSDLVSSMSFVILTPLALYLSRFLSTT